MSKKSDQFVPTVFPWMMYGSEGRHVIVQNLEDYQEHVARGFSNRPLPEAAPEPELTDEERHAALEEAHEVLLAEHEALTVTHKAAIEKFNKRWDGLLAEKDALAERCAALEAEIAKKKPRTKAAATAAGPAPAEAPMATCDECGFETSDPAAMHSHACQ